MSSIVLAENAIATRPLGEELYTRFTNYLDLSKKSIASYTRALKQFKTWLANNAILEPTREDLVSYKRDLEERGLKPATRHAYIIAVRLFFQWLEDEGLYPNIARRLKGVKIDVGHSKEALTQAQAKELIQSIDTTTLKGKRDLAILMLCITGALRMTELRTADIKDLRTLGNSTVLYIKGKKRTDKLDYCKVPPKTEKIIREYLIARGAESVEEPLFASTSNNNAGGRMTTRALSSIAKERLRAIGLDSEFLTAHSLRHTAITFALLGNESLQRVQELARHKDINTTMIYAHNLVKAESTCSNTIENML